jgi:hypothetical protein
LSDREPTLFRDPQQMLAQSPLAEQSGEARVAEGVAEVDGLVVEGASADVGVVHKPLGYVGNHRLEGVQRGSRALPGRGLAGTLKAHATNALRRRHGNQHHIASSGWGSLLPVGT